jgi:hypothetical protein
MRYEIWRLPADHPARHPNDRRPSNLLIAPEDPRYDRLTEGADFIEPIEAESYEEIQNIWFGRMFGATPAERLAHLQKVREEQPRPDSN